MAKRKGNTKSAKSKKAKCAKIEPEVQPEAPIELRPGFKNQLITSLTKLTLAATEACSQGSTDRDNFSVRGSPFVASF